MTGSRAIPVHKGNNEKLKNEIYKGAIRHPFYFLHLKKGTNINTMKQLVLIFLAISSFAYAQTPELNYAYNFPGVASYSTLDNAGNLILAGSFSGTQDFDLGNGTQNLVSTSPTSAFIVKYSPAGNYLMGFVIPSVFVRSITTDNADNIYISGIIDTIVDFDPGVGVATHSNFTSITDLFVAKYDANGNFQMAFVLNSSGLDSESHLRIDSNGNMFLWAMFVGTIDIDPGVGITNFTESGPGTENIFIAKYSSAGNLLYGYAFPNSSSPQEILIDDVDNIYVSGDFQNTIDVDPGPGTAYLTSNNGLDGFWVKYDNDMNYINSASYHGGVNFIALDNDKNFYISGRNPDSMDVDLGPGVTMLYSQDYYDIYIAKYDSSFNLIYGKIFECGLSYLQTALAPDSVGGIYMCGWIPDTVVNFTPGQQQGIFESNGGRDVFLIKLDPTGNYVFGGTFGDTLSDMPNGMRLNPHGDLWLYGTYNGTIDCDFGPAENTLTGTAGKFLAKYTDPLYTTLKEGPAQLPIKIYGAESKVFVDFSALSKTKAEVQIINVMGQTVYQTTHNQSDKLTIDVPETAGQIYFVRVTDGNKTIAKKLWVN